MSPNLINLDNMDRWYFKTVEYGIYNTLSFENLNIFKSNPRNFKSESKSNSPFSNYLKFKSKSKSIQHTLDLNRIQIKSGFGFAHHCLGGPMFMPF